jgi:hypothetical protein
VQHSSDNLQGISIPLVYIVVLSWNNASDVVECLESIRKLDYPNYRIVLVDNDSTDNTPSILRERFPNVHLIVNDRNLGYTGGNNVGIRYALENGADYVLILNDDTTVEPDILSKLVHIAEADSKIGMLGPAIVSYTNHSNEYVGATINWRNGTTAYGSSTASETGEVDYIAGCALMVKSRVALEIGLLDTTFFCYFEDADWCLRCRHAGYRVVAVPHAKVYHKGTPDNAQHNSTGLLYYYLRNQYLFMRRYADWSRWLLFQFYFAYRCLLQFYDFRRKGEAAKAESVIAGFWAGIHRLSGAEQINAPHWFTQLAYNTIHLLHCLLQHFLSLCKHLRQKEC